MLRHLLFFFILFISFGNLFAQSIPSGYPVYEEAIRRGQLIPSKSDSLNHSFLQQPGIKFPNASFEKDLTSIKLGVVPIRLSTFLNSSRPYWYSPQGMIPGKGLQVYASGGVFASHKFFEIDIQPEINAAQNSFYEGYQTLTGPNVDFYFFQALARGDQPETFGDGSYSRIGLGQSKVVGKLGAFEAGVSTRNLWWGPGQWNALTFSNNAPGFFHVTAGTHRPAKTFFGSFEFQLISGLPKSKKFEPFQEDDLNSRVNQFRNRPRYLNALTFSIQPKWIKGFSFGATRTVQTFTDSVSTKKFIDVFPVFWGVSKQQVGSDLVGESDRGRDQQITVFFRQVIPKAGLEFYGEFGRRDHALNLRDLTLSPAHSRAYILGLNKVFNLPGEKLIQVRSEMTQQAQSVNWVVRANSTTPWGTNGTIGGFTNWDQAMGVGAGMGANVQMIELSLVENLNKIGMYFERRAPFADFYDTADLAKNGYKPWVDFTAGPVFDHQWKNLIFSGRMLFTYASNYYWSQELGSQRDVDFPTQNNLFSTSTQVNLIYLFK
ncbi:capsule assembly Wzi family protein [uncultured Algoriphagus sp.]|uniref:capsule assembly Wzi family protein n=1 Tax=uncultured Algoriphagus sp. TaxID=417365 RepID=UPI0030EB42C5